MGRPKIVDGVKISIKLPSDDVKRLKIEAIERGILESSIVLEALQVHWGQAAPHPVKPGQKPSESGKPGRGKSKLLTLADTPEEKAQSTPPPKPKQVRGKRGVRDYELWQKLDSAVNVGQITQAEVMRQVAPGRSASNYNSWKKGQAIPANWVLAVQKVLASLPAPTNQAIAQAQSDES